MSDINPIVCANMKDSLHFCGLSQSHNLFRFTKLGHFNVINFCYYRNVLQTEVRRNPSGTKTYQSWEEKDVDW